MHTSENSGEIRSIYCPSASKHGLSLLRNSSSMRAETFSTSAFPSTDLYHSLFTSKWIYGDEQNRICASKRNSPCARPVLYTPVCYDVSNKSVFTIPHVCEYIWSWRKEEAEMTVVAKIMLPLLLLTTDNK